MGLVGFGFIARRLARILGGFGCRLLACDVKPDTDTAAGLGVEFRTFEELLRESDVVSLHIPLTPETEECINRETLAMMKPEYSNYLSEKLS